MASGDLEKYEIYALVSRVVVELENHLHVNDRTLAEFVIDVALSNPNQKAFLTALKAQGVDFPEHLAANLVRLVLNEHPKSEVAKKKAAREGVKIQTTVDHDSKFPGLAIPNSVPIKLERDNSPPRHQPAPPSRQPPAPPSRQQQQAAPREIEVNQIYRGRVANVADFGCFVALTDFREKKEGLVHVSQVSKEGRIKSAADVVKRGQDVCPH